MGRIYLPTWNMMNTLSISVKTFMEDILRLVREHGEEITIFRLNPSPLTNPALFKARAKSIEQCLLLGVSAEHLLKAILLKNDFIIKKRGKNYGEDFTFSRSLIRNMSLL